MDRAGQFSEPPRIHTVEPCSLYIARNLLDQCLILYTVGQLAETLCVVILLSAVDVEETHHLEIAALLNSMSKAGPATVRESVLW